METWKWKRTWNVGKLEKWCRSEEAVKLEVTGGRGSKTGRTHRSRGDFRFDP